MAYEKHDPLAGLRIKDDFLARALRGEAFLVLDGAMGTQLQRRGLAQTGQLPELLNFTHPDDIAAIHEEYVAAGADVVTTNTFGANARKLEGHVSVAEVYRAAADCARASGARYVAGDIGPTGALLEPLGTLSFEAAYDLFAEQVDAVRGAGCDLILIETMADLREAKAALLAAREHCDLPVFVTMTFGEDGRTFLGTPPEVAAATLSSMGVQAVGLNCSLGPRELLGAVRGMARFSRCPLVAQPNAGLPRMEGEETVYDVTPDEFAEAMEGILDAGAGIVGGCCGTSPVFIAHLRAAVDARCAPVSRAFEPACVLTSAQEAVVLPQGRARIAVIGERINPTGKPKLKAALRAGDFDYLVGEAVAQQEAGADVLDVNVGLPELDEPSALRSAVEKLQATVTLPLVVDSSDPQAVEAAVRGYAGKPLVNSVSGKRESLDAVLPLVKKYGCAVIGLTLDEGGIPSDAEGRFRIAERIVAEAEALGIPRQDVVIDCLVMAAATNQDEVREILRAVGMVKERLGVRTTLGVSNVSFGLPQRNLVNATFLAAALGAGLDMPILNPLAGRYRDAVAAFKVINAQDGSAANFIGAYAKAADPYDGAANAGSRAGGSGVVGVETRGGRAVGAESQRTGAQPRNAAAAVSPVDGSLAAGSLGQPPAPAIPIPIPPSFAEAADEVSEMLHLILTGRRGPMGSATERLLEGHDPLELVNGVFVPALDEVGERFDRGEYFLPQLMASAEAVKAGFDVVKAHMGDAAVADDTRRVALATVKGDIHDIGKNIVKMLLENYGFAVLDLGRDVAPEEVLRAVREHDVRLVGLSALMTTTVKAMEQTIELLHREVPGVKVFVGGAVLTPEYAAQIGADYYSKDAAESARIAERFFAE